MMVVVVQTCALNVFFVCVCNGGGSAASQFKGLSEMKWEVRVLLVFVFGVTGIWEPVVAEERSVHIVTGGFETNLCFACEISHDWVVSVRCCELKRTHSEK